MYKLSGQSLTRGAWFLPETQPMIIQERDSTSTITLGPEAPEIAFDDWLLDDDWQEGDYVWRVKNITDDTNTDTRTVELEHIVKTLDDITLGEVTVETIAGAGATTCTAKQAVQYILSQHDAWTLGDFEYDVSNPYEFNGETLLDALETVSDTLEHAVWEFNLSTFPFKLHIRQRDNVVRCEMRGERNLITLKRSISRSGMYTRIYPTGKNGLQLDGGYLSKNENLYGRVDHRETDQSKSTVENLQAWAQGRLNRHCEPRVTIQISGLELSHETGEALDSLTMNKVCQCPLPEYSTTITERIVKKQWRDRRKEPENVNVTLANNVTDITTIVKEQVRDGSSGRAGAGQAKQNCLFEANGEHLLYELFDECGHVHGLLRMTSESLRIAFENLNDSTRSEFMLTAESLRVQFENEINSTRSEFQLTSESLRIQFENEIQSTRSELQLTSESLRIAFENLNDSTRSEFQLTSESLRIEFQNTTSSLRSAIQAEAGKIAMVVGTNSGGNFIKAAEIATSINNAGEGVATIDADKIMIGNEKATTVIDGKLEAKDITTDLITSKLALAATVTTNVLSSQVLMMAGNNVAAAVRGVRVTDGATAGSYVLQYNTFSNDSWTDAGTFNGAASVDFYSEGLWSSGDKILTLTNGKTHTVSIPTPSASDWSAAYIGIQSNDPKMSVSVIVGGKSLTQTVSAGDAYNAGKSSVTLSKGSWSEGALVVTASNGETTTVSIPASSGTEWVNTEDDKWRADLTIGGVTRHSTVKNFASIRTAGANSVTLSQGSWSDGTLTVTASNGKTTTVSLPSVSSTTWQDRGSGKWRVRLTIGGAYRYSAVKDFSSLFEDQYDAGYDAGYKAGWNECIDACGFTNAYFYTGAVRRYLYPGPMTPTGQGQYYDLADGYKTVPAKK